MIKRTFFEKITLTNLILLFIYIFFFLKFNLLEMILMSVIFSISNSIIKKNNKYYLDMELLIVQTMTIFYLLRKTIFSWILIEDIPDILILNSKYINYLYFITIIIFYIYFLINKKKDVFFKIYTLLITLYLIIIQNAFNLKIFLFSQWKLPFTMIDSIISFYFIDAIIFWIFIFILNRKNKKYKKLYILLFIYILIRYKINYFLGGY